MADQQRRRKYNHMQNIRKEMSGYRSEFEKAPIGSMQEHLAFSKVKHLSKMLKKNRAELKQMDEDSRARERARRAQTTDKDN